MMTPLMNRACGLFLRICKSQLLVQYLKGPNFIATYLIKIKGQSFIEDLKRPGFFVSQVKGENHLISMVPFDLFIARLIEKDPA